jgi:hypothetical protein
MAKLTKHAEVLNQLHSMVKKQAEEAQKNISGLPGEDVKSVSVGDEHENVNKNSVGPENVAQGVSQKPSDDPSEPVAKAKTAESLGAEILDIIRKSAEAQSSVTGKPGDVKSESVGDEHEKINKNDVKPESNTPQEHDQKPSSDASEPVAKAKKAEEAKSEVEELAAKVASYELGRQFCAALLKTASEHTAPDEAELMKEAGRRDFDLLISQAAEDLEGNTKVSEQDAEKQAEEAGAAYFDEVLKQAALEEAINENKTLQVKLAEYEAYLNSEYQKQAAAEQARLQEENQVKLAESVANIVLGKLKSEVVPVAPASAE